MCGRSGSFRAFLSRAARAAPACAQSRASRVTVPVAMPMRRQQPDDAVEAGRTRGARRRIAGAGATCRLDARIAASPELADLLAEQQRAVALARSAATEVEAPAALRARIEHGRARRRPAPWRLVAVGSAVAVVAAIVVALAVRSTGTHGRAIPRGSRAHRLLPGAGGEATMTKTSSGWRIELEADGAAPPRGPPVLSGVAAQSRRRAGADRDIQREPEGHAVGGRVTQGLSGPDRHAGAGGRQSGLFG